MRVQPPVRVHARIHHQAKIQRIRKNPVDKLPPERRELLHPRRVPEEIRLPLRDRHIGVHPAPVHPHHRLRQVARRAAHAGRNLPRQQLVELNLIRRSHHLPIAVIDLKLARRNLRMVLLVLETHRPLHLRRSVDKPPQWVQRQGMVVPARRDKLKLPRLVEPLLRVHPVEEKPLNLIRRVQRPPLFPVKIIGVLLQHPAQIPLVGLAILSNHNAKDQHLPRPEHIRRHPVERAPIGHLVQIEVDDLDHLRRGLRFTKTREAAQIAEQHRHRLDPLLIRQIFQAFVANLVNGKPAHPVRLGFQVHLLQLGIVQSKKIAVRIRHETLLLALQSFEWRSPYPIGLFNFSIQGNATHPPAHN